jgi:ferredoxin--NADP+ reductase
MYNHLTFYLPGNEHGFIMNIIDKTILVNAGGVRIVRFEIHAPDIAAKAKPGQFIVLMATESGERIPLTIVKTDAGKGTVSIIVQEAGFTTKLLGSMQVNDVLYAMVGPLGHPTEIKKYGKVIVVGGGVGVAEIYPVAAAMKIAGNRVTAILGARSRELLILEQEMRTVAHTIFIMTDDGSYGRKGFVTDSLAELLGKDTYDLVYAVGPIPMMRAIARATKTAGTDRIARTIVSLNTIMVDATGMCGCCRVIVGGAMKFSCVDGPEFDAHEIDWEDLLKRNAIYDPQEKHMCQLPQK